MKFWQKKKKFHKKFGKVATVYRDSQNRPIAVMQSRNTGREYFFVLENKPEEVPKKVERWIVVFGKSRKRRAERCGSIFLTWLT